MFSIFKFSNLLNITTETYGISSNFSLSLRKCEPPSDISHLGSPCWEAHRSSVLAAKIAVAFPAGTNITNRVSLSTTIVGLPVTVHVRKLCSNMYVVM